MFLAPGLAFYGPRSSIPGFHGALGRLSYNYIATMQSTYVRSMFRPFDSGSYILHSSLRPLSS